MIRATLDMSYVWNSKTTTPQPTRVNTIIQVVVPSSRDFSGSSSASSKGGTGGFTGFTPFLDLALFFGLVFSSTITAGASLPVSAGVSEDSSEMVPRGTRHPGCNPGGLRAIRRCHFLARDARNSVTGHIAIGLNHWCIRRRFFRDCGYLSLSEIACVTISGGLRYLGIFRRTAGTFALAEQQRLGLFEYFE